MSIKFGDRVRITKAYDAVDKGFAGVEFDVTAFIESPWVSMEGKEYFGYAQGDPMGRGVWDTYLEVVKPNEPKAHTATIISTRLNWEGLDRMVKVTSGTSGLGLTVSPNPAKFGDIEGVTSLTVEQAEQLGNDLLARVAEIRAGQKR